MSRPGDFSRLIQNQAFDRQKGKCGICGGKLTQIAFTYQAHHIVSALYGGKNELDNCVILCCMRKDEDQGCHIFAHGDYYHRKFELDRRQYVFFYG